MYATRRLWCQKDIHFVESILTVPTVRVSSACLLPLERCRPQYTYILCQQVRGAKTISKRRLKDLDQGIVASESLPAQEPDNAPQYPALLKGVKSNMVKFDKCVLLTRVGNFYELYFDHAEKYGPLLGLKVSARRTTVGPVSMAGFPLWQLDRFLKILVSDLNNYVAISEEFPVSTTDKVKAGGVMYDRKVARVVTPGTLIDEKFLNPYQNNFLLSIQSEEILHAQNDSGEVADQNMGLAWLDLSTGDFLTQFTTKSLLPSILMRIEAREILLSSKVSSHLRGEIEMILGHSHDLVTTHDPRSEFTNMTEWNSVLECPMPDGAEAAFTTPEKLAGHRLLDYVQTQLQESQLRLQQPRKREAVDAIVIDRSSLRGLEILETSRDGFGKGSLFHTVKRTVTNSGARLLRDRLTAPSASLAEINRRLDLISKFHESESLQEGLIHHLQRTYDVQRLVQKFALNKGDADDMLCLARAIYETSQAYQLLDDSSHVSSSASDGGTNSAHLEPFRALLDRFQLEGPGILSQSILGAIDEEGLSQKHRLEENEAADVAGLVQEIVMDTAPEELESFPKAVRSKSKVKEQDIEIEDAWIMRRNASATLQRLHESLDNLKNEKAGLTQRLRSEFSAPSLTLKWTPGLGHICHIKKTTGINQALLDSMNARMVSSSKSTKSLYITEWSRLGTRMEQARLHIRNEEQRIFLDLRQLVIQNLIYLRRNAAIMDELDVAISFSILAQEQSWTRPILNAGKTHKIVGGRHPTVKLGLEEQGRSFVSNDLFLGDNERIWIVTGPNMAGKSTFLRQNALITILAQVGSYVPAEHAEIGIVDQIFSRIGAADDLFRDQSTFMVEMLETAAILKHATPRSFVIMDEVGRGTTPEDGTAVAYACLHHLYHTNRCRTLFATHFHYLADATQTWTKLGRYCTDILEDETGSFSFIHKLRPGINRQSHALKVAKMAGLPQPALEVAKHLLDEFQQEQISIQPSTSISEQEYVQSSATAS